MPLFFEIDIIHFIHQFRNPLLDQIFLFLNYFDRVEFFFVLIPMLWLGVGWKVGFRVFYLFILSGIWNHALKEFFVIPRPFHADPSVEMIRLSGYSFPSGAAQTSMFLSSLLLFQWKHPAKWVVAPIYLFLISFSRVYLGVHYPSDILGGWIVGLGLLAVYAFLIPFIEQKLASKHPVSLLALSQAVPLLLLAHYQFSPPALMYFGNAMGMGLGIFLTSTFNQVFPPPKGLLEFVLRAFFGVAGVFALVFLLSNSAISLGVQAICMGLWMSFISPALCLFFKNGRGERAEAVKMNR